MRTIRSNHVRHGRRTAAAVKAASGGPTPRRRCAIRVADPWSFYKARGVRADVADLFGRPRAVSGYWRGGVWTFAPGRADLATALPASGERSMLAELRRCVAAEIAKYRINSQVSPKELRTIEALWRDGFSLREHARRERVAPQAIESRIDHVRERAVRFWTWWRLKNRMRRRR